MNKKIYVLLSVVTMVGIMSGCGQTTVQRDVNDDQVNVSVNGGAASAEMTGDDVQVVTPGTTVDMTGGGVHVETPGTTVDIEQ